MKACKLLKARQDRCKSIGALHQVSPDTEQRFFRFSTTNEPGLTARATTQALRRIIRGEMALHGSSSTMAIEVIQEFLYVSDICIKSQKSSGGCFGYTATLLLFFIVDAFGVWLRNDTVQIGGRGQKIKNEPFRVLNHGIFGLGLTGAQIKILEHSYRNALAHSAIIRPGAFLVQGPNVATAAFTFASNRVQVINVDSFHQLVAQAWAQFPKNRLP